MLYGSFENNWNTSLDFKWLKEYIVDLHQAYCNAYFVLYGGLKSYFIFEKELRGATIICLNQPLYCDT